MQWSDIVVVILKWLRKRNAANLAPSQNIVVIIEGPFYDSGEYVGIEVLQLEKRVLAMAYEDIFERGHPARETARNVRFEFEDMQLWSMLVSARWGGEGSEDQAWIGHMQEIKPLRRPMWESALWE